MPLLMLVVTCLVFVDVGTFSFWSYIASSLPSLVWWSILMIWLELLLPKRRGECVITLCCLAQLSFGLLIGSVVLFLLLLLRIWVPGLILLVYRLSGSLSQVLCIGRLLELTWVLEEVSFVELFTLCEVWAGERLVLE